jgi:hypothetical protein
MFLKNFYYKKNKIYVLLLSNLNETKALPVNTSFVCSGGAPGALKYMLYAAYFKFVLSRLI